VVWGLLWWALLRVGCVGLVVWDRLWSALVRVELCGLLLWVRAVVREES